MTVWNQQNWLDQTQILLDSYRHWLGQELIDRSGSAEQQARRLFEATFVVVSHGTQSDPILNYGNRAALELWETEMETFLRTPSRLTAEPVHREERAKLLERTGRDGYVDDYSGIRISTSGRRFFIPRATVWNLLDRSGTYVGQAATFAEWTYLE